MQSSAQPKRWLFAHPDDKHCALYNVFVLAAYGLAFWLYLHPQAAQIESAWDRAAFIFGAAFLLGWISGINVGVNFHNHTHRPIFRSAFLNLWFERIWAFSGGWPAFYWAHSHVTVHHSNLLGKKDWTMPRRHPDGRFENIYLYVLGHWPWRFVPHLWRDFSSPPKGHWIRKKALKEGLIFLALWSIPFWIDPWMALGLWVFPQWIGNAMIMGSGMYVQHAGCQEKSAQHPYRHSNTFTSKFFNLTMFNIGYHVAHHDHAQVHWSDLPEFNASLKSRLVQAGVHAVPYGYFRAANLCSAPWNTTGGYDRFLRDQDPGYPLPAYPSPGQPRNRQQSEPQASVNQ